MSVQANAVGPNPVNGGYAGYYTSAANGGVSQLVDVNGGFLGGLVQGSKVWVQSFRDSFTWYPLDTSTPDNVTVVKPTVVGAGAGRFIRDLIPSPTWMESATWVIDPVNGHDENVGATAGAGNALKTDAERQRRWGFERRALVNTAATVTYASDLPVTDVVNYDVAIGSAGSLAIVGTPSVVKSSTLLSVVTQNRGTQTPWSGTSTVAFDGTEVGKLIQITGGARAGNNFWVVKDNTGGSLRWTPPGARSNFDWAPVTPVAGDPYSVLSPTAITVRTWRFAYTGSAGAGSHPVTVDGLSIAGITTTSEIQTVDVQLFVTRCSVSACQMARMNGNLYAAFGCLISGSSSFGVRFMGGGATGSLSVYGIPTNIDRDFIFQASQLFVYGGYVSIGLAAFFDKSTTDAVLVYPGGTVESAPLFGGADLIWGTNNVGYGVRVKSGGRLVYTTKPTINAALGAGRETIVGGTDKQWGSVPFADSGATGTQAAIVPLA